ncbi:MAG: diacylglycerol kinase family lipid kinase [Candidatus Aminicenantes bacterium]|nr:diacylglycerol kinase family lipid kinase [Candidatus Aminicenantes bacterium]
MTEKIALIYNPSAGGGKAQRRQGRVEACLEAKGIRYDLFVTESEAHLVETAEIVAQRYPVILGAGGDTTLNIIATQILRNGKKNVLGIISLGSVNDLAREIGVHRLEKAANAIKHHITREFDVGVVRDPKQSQPYYFLVSASLGLGVEVNRYVDIWMRKHPFFATFRSTTQGTAAMSAIHQAFKNKQVPLELTLECNGDRYTIVTSLLIFGNISSYGGTFRLSPTASPVSGKLDCCIFDFNSLAGVARVSLDIKRQKHLEKNTVKVLQGESFKIHARKPLDFQLDGEIIRLDGEVEIAILPKALTMFTFDCFPGETSPGGKKLTMQRGNRKWGKKTTI